MLKKGGLGTVISLILLLLVIIVSVIIAFNFNKLKEGSTNFVSRIDFGEIKNKMYEGFNSKLKFSKSYLVDKAKNSDNGVAVLTFECYEGETCTVGDHSVRVISIVKDEEMGKYKVSLGISSSDEQIFEDLKEGDVIVLRDDVIGETQVFEITTFVDDENGKGVTFVTKYYVTVGIAIKNVHSGDYYQTVEPKQGANIKLLLKNAADSLMGKAYRRQSVGRQGILLFKVSKEDKLAFPVELGKKYVSPVETGYNYIFTVEEIILGEDGLVKGKLEYSKTLPYDVESAVEGIFVLNELLVWGEREGYYNVLKESKEKVTKRLNGRVIKDDVGIKGADVILYSDRCVTERSSTPTVSNGYYTFDNVNDGIYVKARFNFFESECKYITDDNWVDLELLGPKEYEPLTVTIRDANGELIRSAKISTYKDKECSGKTLNALEPEIMVDNYKLYVSEEDEFLKIEASGYKTVCVSIPASKELSIELVALETLTTTKKTKGEVSLNDVEYIIPEYGGNLSIEIKAKTFTKEDLKTGVGLTDIDGEVIFIISKLTDTDVEAGFYHCFGDRKLEKKGVATKTIEDILDDLNKGLLKYKTPEEMKTICSSIVTETIIKETVGEKYSLKGRVVRDGAGVSGLKVILHDGKGCSSEVSSVQTSNDGNYVFTNLLLKGSEHSVVVNDFCQNVNPNTLKDGFYELNFEISEKKEKESKTIDTIPSFERLATEEALSSTERLLKRATLVHLLVFDEKNKPIEKAHVYFEWLSGYETRSLGGYTDASGYFEFSNFPIGSWLMTIRLNKNKPFENRPEKWVVLYEELVEIFPGVNDLGSIVVTFGEKKKVAKDVSVNKLNALKCNGWEIVIPYKGDAVCFNVYPNCDYVLEDRKGDVYWGHIELSNAQKSSYKTALDSHYKLTLNNAKKNYNGYLGAIDVRKILNLLENYCLQALNDRIQSGQLQRPWSGAKLTSENIDPVTGDESKMLDSSVDMNDVNDVATAKSVWESEIGYHDACYHTRFEVRKVMKGLTPFGIRPYSTYGHGWCVYDQYDLWANTIATFGGIPITEWELRGMLCEGECDLPDNVLFSDPEITRKLEKVKKNSLFVIVGDGKERSSDKVSGSGMSGIAITVEDLVKFWEKMWGTFPDIHDYSNEICYFGDPENLRCKDDIVKIESETHDTAEERRYRYLFSVGWNPNSNRGKWLSYMETRYPDSPCKNGYKPCMDWLYNNVIVNSPIFKLYPSTGSSWSNDLSDFIHLPSKGETGGFNY